MKHIMLVFLLNTFAKIALAQLTISSPIQKAVYQKDLAGYADIDVGGNYNFTIVTSIQARILQVDAPIVVKDWQIIESNPTKGYFKGKISQVPAGWYKLELRAVKSGVVLGTTTLDYFGVGDVFMIAGQSNAQGYFGNPPDFEPVGLGSDDERVVTHHNGMYCSNAPIPFPVLTQIVDTTKIGTAGRAAWLYGKLGERIVDSTHTPVAFFNSGAAGSSTRNWVNSAQGLPSDNPFTNEPFCSDPEENEGRPYDAIGMPYSNFKRGLNLYNSMFGAKGVLWHQGESDNYLGISSSEYYNNLSYIINKSRGDFNSNLPWVVARASYINGTSSSDIIGAQENVIATVPNTHGGPYTDWMNNSSEPGSRDWLDLHFSKSVGFPFVIDGWMSWLFYFGYMRDVAPVSANTIPKIAIEKEGANLVMSAPLGYNAYKWIRIDVTQNSSYEGTISVGSSNQITASEGTYRCWVVESNGNLQVSDPINVNLALALEENLAVCNANVSLSDFKYAYATNEKGPIEINKTYGGENDGDGSPIVLDGRTYSKGLGVFGNSEIRYNLPSNTYYRFQAKVGLASESSDPCTNSGLIFKVYAGNSLLYVSPTLIKDSAAHFIDIAISGKTDLKLVTEAPNFSDCNSGIWADLKLLCNRGDTIQPSNPDFLTTKVILTKCAEIEWQAASDNRGLLRYDIFKNGVWIDTVSALSTSYWIKDLEPGEEFTFGVMAVDSFSNFSDRVYVEVIAETFQLNYQHATALCTLTEYLPNELHPLGGVFELENNSLSSIDSLTGKFQTSRVGNDFVVHYILGADVEGCVDTVSVALQSVSKPTKPVINVNNNLINEGQSVSFSSTTCTNGSVLEWSFSASSSNPLVYAPLSTSSYSVSCKLSACAVSSEPIQVQVIPNCRSSINLVSPNDDLSSRTNALRFSASGTVQASNKIVPTNKVDYTSAKSITLQPGFSVEPGVVFKAEIKNCP